MFICLLCVWLLKAKVIPSTVGAPTCPGVGGVYCPREKVVSVWFPALNKRVQTMPLCHVYIEVQQESLGGGVKDKCSLWGVQ